MVSMLQLPPPLELAIGQLSAADQSHVQVSMRVLAAHLKAPCVLVTKDTGDITLKPDPRDHKIIHATSATDEVRLDRPMRLVPLSEALSKLIDGIVSLTQQAAPASTDFTAFAVDATSAQPALFDLLLDRSHPGPLEVHFASGQSLLIDSRYSVAHLSSPVAQMLPMLATGRIIQIAQVSNEEFTHRTRKGSDLQPLGVEQICWALTATPSAMPALDRWHRDDDARVSLDTWPNLSAQPDAQAWLEVLSTAFHRGMTVGALRDCAIKAGIPTERANHGISLLFTYRHARIVASGVAAEQVVVQLPVARRTAPPSGLLGRLRSRLRALAMAA